MKNKSLSVQELIRPVHRFRVFPNRDYDLSLAEMAVLQTSPIQRLRKLRQIGLGYLALPTAEHSRLAHSLGTAYWAVEFLNHLRSNFFSQSVGDGFDPPGNSQRLDDLEAGVGPDVSTDLVVRLFALVHDMTLLPLGHTLQYQLGYFNKQKNNAGRAQWCLQWIRKELKTALSSVYGGSDFWPLYEGLMVHLDIVQRIFDFREHSAPTKIKQKVSGDSKVPAEVETAFYPLVIDLIASTFSADLVDFALRDSLGAGMSRNYDEGLMDYLCVFSLPVHTGGARRSKSGRGKNFGRSPHSTSYRLGLNPLRDTYRDEVVSGVLSLQRIRYELAEKVFYHEEKLVADAMLDRVIRLIDQDCHGMSQESGSFSQQKLLRMGDEDFLNLLLTKERQVVSGKGSGTETPQKATRPIVGKPQRKTTSAKGLKPLMPELLARRLYKEVFRVSSVSDLSPDARSLVERAAHPRGRTALERKILRRIPALTENDVIVSSRPFSMQAKPSSVLVAWTDGRPVPLMDIARRFGYATEALDLADRYLFLWSLSVYLRPEASLIAPKVKEVCQALFKSPS